jgi:glycosyltransferase involved in cell wall biosynthesis
MNNFLVITDAHLIQQNGKKVAYAPYVREMDLWMRHVDQTTFICPDRMGSKLLAQPFLNQDFKQIGLRRLEFHTLFSAVISFLSIPYQFIVLCFAFAKADHIHLRCPGNLALLASMAQILFPSKRKTVKYAGNFDPCASQPIAYRLQKRILSNTFLTKNIKVLVYGNWPNQTKNIQPFFTASYHRNQIEPVANRNWNGPCKAVFVGTMRANKRPLEVFELIKELRANGLAISLDYYGDGPLKKDIENKVKQAGLEDHVRLHGNVDNTSLIQAYKMAHFSFLLSKSEGWPKAVAEAMFWGCIPVASKVSCVPWMLGIETSNFQLPTSNADKETYPLGLGKGFDDTQRGILIIDILQAGTVVKEYLKQPDQLEHMSKAAAAWSQQYTLDDFEREIALLLKETDPIKATKK